MISGGEVELHIQGFTERSKEVRDKFGVSVGGDIQIIHVIPRGTATTSQVASILILRNTVFIHSFYSVFKVNRVLQHNIMS
jgi:hypothetical protein